MEFNSAFKWLIMLYVSAIALNIEKILYKNEQRKLQKMTKEAITVQVPS